MRNPGRAFLVAGLVFYALVGGAGALWMALRGDPASRFLCDPRVPAALALGAGLLLGLAVVLLSDLSLDRFSWTQRLRREVVAIFAPLTPLRAVLLALASGIAEELFFRGALQPAIGLVPAALVFGVLHSLTDWRFLGWAAFAVVVGALLGLLYAVTGGVLAPAAAHVCINGTQLVRLATR